MHYYQPHSFVLGRRSTYARSVGSKVIPPASAAVRNTSCDENHASFFAAEQSKKRGEGGGSVLVNLAKREEGRVVIFKG